MDTNNKIITTTDNIPDEEVISRVMAGNRNLYSVLIRRYNQRLYRVAMSILNNDSETEEAMHVAYIKAFENLGKFEKRSAFSTWLTRILINECLLRVKKRNRALIIDDDMIENEIQQHSGDTVKTPLMSVLNSELRSILEKAISQLPDKYRTVFIMRELENMSIIETQECLDLTEENVKVRLNRAKAMLRNSLTSLYKKEDLLSFHLVRCDRITENVMKEIAQKNV
jgi:RNA polymerase sigma-70 factor (ECF subfamily)